MSAMPRIAAPSMLFCPADRPDRYGKALARADSVILDLEDAVHAEAKDDARQSLRDWCHGREGAGALESDPARVVVRVNPGGTEDSACDVQMLSQTPVRVVMLAKTESAEQLDRCASALPGVSIIALCETPKGVAASAEIARHPAVTAVMWGAEDLVAAIGGSSSRRPDGRYRDVARVARGNVLLSAAAAGVPAIDSIYADFTDSTGLADEAQDACASGFQMKGCIHPSQVPVVRQAFVPTDAEVDYAQALLQAVHSTRGAVQFRGAMVDEPLIRHAENIVERALTAQGRTPSGP